MLNTRGDLLEMGDVLRMRWQGPFMVKVAGRSRKVPVDALHSGVESRNQTSGEGAWDVGKLAMYFRRSALSIFCCGHSCFTAM